MKTGIALPGSKNAGAFAIGVLKALEELGIAPQMAAASGDAAFPAVLYASGCGMEELEPLYTYYRGYAQPKNRFSSLLDWIFRKNRLRKYLEDQMSGLKVRTVRQIQKPLALMMTDLISGREVLTAPLAESRSDELDVVPDLLLSEVIYACAKGVGRVEYRGQKAELCPLGVRRSHAIWALRRMGAQKVLGVREKRVQKEHGDAGGLYGALEVARQAQGRLEQMSPLKEDAVILIPEHVRRESIRCAVETGYCAVMEQQEALYDTLLFEKKEEG